MNLQKCHFFFHRHVEDVERRILNTINIYGRAKIGVQKPFLQYFACFCHQPGVLYWPVGPVHPQYFKQFTGLSFLNYFTSSFLNFSLARGQWPSTFLNFFTGLSGQCTPSIFNNSLAQVFSTTLLAWGQCTSSFLNFSLDWGQWPSSFLNYFTGQPGQCTSSYLNQSMVCLFSTICRGQCTSSFLYYFTGQWQIKSVLVQIIQTIRLFEQ